MYGYINLNRCDSVQLSQFTTRTLLGAHFIREFPLDKCIGRELNQMKTVLYLQESGNSKASQSSKFRIKTDADA